LPGRRSGDGTEFSEGVFLDVYGPPGSLRSPPKKKSKMGMETRPTAASAKRQLFSDSPLRILKKPEDLEEEEEEEPLETIPESEELFTPSRPRRSKRTTRKPRRLGFEEEEDNVEEEEDDKEGDEKKQPKGKGKGKGKSSKKKETSAQKKPDDDGPDLMDFSEGFPPFLI
jgi:hypothetical protein